MPISVDLIGQSTPAITHEVDDRWLMAYAAGLGCLSPAYMDTAGGPLLVHPLFPVCLEWPSNLAVAQLPGYASATREERARGVHYGHDLHLLRPIRPGTFTTVATVVGVEQRPSGAAQTMRFDTRDASDVLVAQTFQVSIYRGVSITGEGRIDEELPIVPTLAPGPQARRREISVAAGAAHVYTECARIFNPIHTDRAVALAAGLPDIILHGTATLALAVSSVLEQFVTGDPSRVRRLGGRFSAMVQMPEVLVLRAEQQAPGSVAFEVDNGPGAIAIKGGFLLFE